jgi:hypothetical protein
MVGHTSTVTEKKMDNHHYPPNPRKPMPDRVFAVAIGTADMSQ